MARDNRSRNAHLRVVDLGLVWRDIAGAEAGLRSLEPRIASVRLRDSGERPPLASEWLNSLFSWWWRLRRASLIRTRAPATMTTSWDERRATSQSSEAYGWWGRWRWTTMPSTAPTDPRSAFDLWGCWRTETTGVGEEGSTDVSSFPFSASLIFISNQRRRMLGGRRRPRRGVNIFSSFGQIRLPASPYFSKSNMVEADDELRVERNLDFWYGWSLLDSVILIRQLLWRNAIMGWLQRSDSQWFKSLALTSPKIWDITFLAGQI